MTVPGTYLPITLFYTESLEDDIIDLTLEDDEEEEEEDNSP